MVEHILKTSAMAEADKPTQPIPSAIPEAGGGDVEVGTVTQATHHHHYAVIPNVHPTLSSTQHQGYHNLMNNDSNNFDASVLQFKELFDKCCGLGLTCHIVTHVPPSNHHALVFKKDLPKVGRSARVEYAIRHHDTWSMVLTFALYDMPTPGDEHNPDVISRLLLKGNVNDFIHPTDDFGWPPTWMVHPCNFHQLLQDLKLPTTFHVRNLLTFITVYGPSVGLHIPLKVAQSIIAKVPAEISTSQGGPIDSPGSKLDSGSSSGSEGKFNPGGFFPAGVVRDGLSRAQSDFSGLSQNRFAAAHYSESSFAPTLDSELLITQTSSIQNSSSIPELAVKTPKRGRPIGSKNKKNKISNKPGSDGALGIQYPGHGTANQPKLPATDSVALCNFNGGPFMEPNCDSFGVPRVQHPGYGMATNYLKLPAMESAALCNFPDGSLMETNSDSFRAPGIQHPGYGTAINQSTPSAMDSADLCNFNNGLFIQSNCDSFGAPYQPRLSADTIECGAQNSTYQPNPNGYPPMYTHQYGMLPVCVRPAGSPEYPPFQHASYSNNLQQQTAAGYAGQGSSSFTSAPGFGSNKWCPNNSQQEIASSSESQGSPLLASSSLTPEPDFSPNTETSNITPTNVSNNKPSETKVSSNSSPVRSELTPGKILSLKCGEEFRKRHSECFPKCVRIESEDSMPADLRPERRTIDGMPHYILPRRTETHRNHTLNSQTFNSMLGVYGGGYSDFSSIFTPCLHTDANPAIYRNHNSFTDLFMGVPDIFSSPNIPSRRAQSESLEPQPSSEGCQKRRRLSADSTPGYMNHSSMIAPASLWTSMDNEEAMKQRVDGIPQDFNMPWSSEFPDPQFDYAEAMAMTVMESME